VEKPDEKSNLEDLTTDLRILLKCVFRKEEDVD
jgi:hypothetical protein